jgi:Tat protein secretion system quality control protein TatD with DNase activity
MSTTEQTPEVIDIGVNLAHRSFYADRDKVIQRAFATGVRTMVITGTSVAGSEEGVRIAREYPPASLRNGRSPPSRQPTLHIRNDS